MKMFKWLLRVARPQATPAPRKRDFLSSYDVSAPVDYETRVVAFFDILGWGQADKDIDKYLVIHRKDENVLAKYTWLKERWQAAKGDAGWRVAIQKKLRAE
jgi:hypothetical protein